MKTLIFGKTSKDAQEKFLEIISELKYEDILRVTRNSSNISAEIKNGDYYKAVSASDSSRGYKFDKAYIQNGIDKEIIDNVICPCLCMSKLPEDEQIVYY